MLDKAEFIHPPRKFNKRVDWTIVPDDYEEIVGAFQGFEIFEGELIIGVDDSKVVVPLSVLSVLQSIRLRQGARISILRTNDNSFPIRIRMI